MKHLMSFTLCLIIVSYCFGQKFPEATASQVVCKDGEFEIKAQLAESTDKLKHPSDALFYSWYARGNIHSTQGGFDGLLLNGSYCQYYAGHKLKEKGQFQLGLKHGAWLSWEEDGVLISRIQWKKGIEQGKFRYYDEDGDLKEEGKHSLGKKQGKVLTYSNGKKLQKLRYKNGELIPRERSSSLSFRKTNKAKDEI